MSLTENPGAEHQERRIVQGYGGLDNALDFAFKSEYKKFDDSNLRLLLYRQCIANGFVNHQSFNIVFLGGAA